MKVCLLHPQGTPEPQESPVPNSEDLVRDLALEQIMEAMAGGDEYLLKVVQRRLFDRLEDPETILYRQAILRDCLQHSREVEELYNITLGFMERKSRWWYLSTTRSSPSLVLGSALHILEASLDSLRELRQLALRHGGAFESGGFSRFFAMLEEELSEEYLAEVEDHVKNLKFPKGALFSVQLGPGNQGIHYRLCRPGDGGERWLKRLLPNRSPSYSFSIHPRDDHGLKVLADLRDMGLERAAIAVSRAADHIEGFFNRGFLQEAERGTGLLPGGPQPLQKTPPPGSPHLLSQTSAPPRGE